MGKLFKRPGGKVWQTWIRERSGRWVRKSTNCTDQRAAAAVSAELERDAADPAHRASRTTTTQRILDDYLASRKRIGRSAGTLHHVRVKSGALLALLPSRGEDITHAAVERYVDARLEEGVMRTTVLKELRVLRPALQLARRNGLWLGEPSDVIPELDDDSAPGERALTPWELVALVRELEPARAAHVAFIVATGARWGESLRASSPDYESSDKIRLRGTKTKASARIVPLVGVARTLMDWSLDKAEPPFERWLNVNRDLAAACARAGIAPVTPNDLRRTFGTWLRNAGVEPQLIGAAMGHTDSRMVERVYGKLTPEALGKLLSTALLMRGEAAATGRTCATAEASALSEPPELPALPVRRDGIEPPTRGFSVPNLSEQTHENASEFASHVGRSASLMRCGHPPAWVQEAALNLALLRFAARGL